MQIVSRRKSVSPELRARILAELEARRRKPIYLSTLTGKTKQWASDFTHGRGGLSPEDLAKIAQGLDLPVNELLRQGLPADVMTPPQESRPMSDPLTGTEQMIIAIWRQLGAAHQHALLQMLTKLLWQQTQARR